MEDLRGGRVGHDRFEGPGRRPAKEAATEAAVSAPDTASATLMDHLGNQLVGAALQGDPLGGLQSVVQRQARDAGVFDRGLGDPMASNTEVQALLFGSESPLVGLADAALELQVEAMPPAPEGPQEAPAETVETATATATETEAAAEGDAPAASPEMTATVAAVAEAEGSGAEVDDDQLEAWARTILQEEAQRRLAETRDRLTSEIAPRYEGEGAEAEVQALRDLADHYDTLLTGQAALYAQSLMLGVRQGAVHPVVDADLYAELGAELATAQADIATLEAARTLLLQDSPELARVVEGDAPHTHQSRWGIDDDTYTNRLADLDDEAALALVRGEIDGVVQNLDDTSGRIASGDLDALDLGTMGRQTLGTLAETYPRVTAGMQGALEDHEYWQKAQDLGVVAVDVAVLALATVVSGGTALVLEGAAAGLSLAAAADNLETALDLADAGDTHLDPERSLVEPGGSGAAYWAGVDLVLSGLGLGMAGKSIADLAAARHVARSAATGAENTPGLAPENFVIRREGFGHDLATDPAARAFADASASSAELALRAIDDGELTSATEVLDFLAERRAAIAQASGDDAADTFGVMREPLAPGLSYQTPLTGRYEHVQDRAMQMPDGQITGTLADGTEVPLTSLGLPLRLNHTDGEHLPAILDHVDGLYADLAKQPDLPHDEVVRRVGEMHWWLAQAMPYARGSAAVSATFSRTLLARRGLDLGPTREGVALDLDALVEPSVDAFAARYGSLHEGPGQ